MPALFFVLTAASSESSAGLGQGQGANLALQPGSGGWQSARGCNYPQELVLQLERPGEIHEVEVVARGDLAPRAVEVHLSTGSREECLLGEPGFKHAATLELASPLLSAPGSRVGTAGRRGRQRLLMRCSGHVKLLVHEPPSAGLPNNNNNPFRQVALTSVGIWGHEDDEQDEQIHLNKMLAKSDFGNGHEQVRKALAEVGIFLGSRGADDADEDELQQIAGVDGETQTLIQELQARQGELVGAGKLGEAQQLAEHLGELAVLGRELNRLRSRSEDIILAQGTKRGLEEAVQLEPLIAALEARKNDTAAFYQTESWLEKMFSRFGVAPSALEQAFYQNQPRVCQIDEAQQRGMLLDQLHKVRKYCAQHLRTWQDTNQRSPTFGLMLDQSSLNLYHVDTFVILPSTEPDRCSFIELLASSSQPSAVFVSHWWGENHFDFIDCVEAFVNLRDVAATEQAFWICAYANRQHELSLDITADPRDSSFYRALEFTGFNILVVLNANGSNSRTYEQEAMPFTRSWCTFEISKCLAQAGSQLSFAAKLDTGVQMLSPGLTASEELLEKRLPGEGFKAKLAREDGFPASLSLLGLTTKLEQAMATLEVDRIRILNSLAGRPQHELDLPPPETHENFDRLNKQLNRRFAYSFLRLAGGDTSGSLAEAVRTAMLHDDSTSELRLKIGGRGSLKDDQELAFFTSCISRAVQEVAIDGNASQITDASLEAIGKALPSGIKDLELNLANCEGVTDVGFNNFISELSKQKSKGGGLQNLRLQLEGSGLSEELQAKAIAMGDAFDAWNTPSKDPSSWVNQGPQKITSRGEIFPAAEAEKRWLQSVLDSGGTYVEKYGFSSVTLMKIDYEGHDVVLMFRGENDRCTDLFVEDVSSANDILAHLKRNPKLFDTFERPRESSS